MSHAIDTDGTAEKLFVLQHLAYGSKSYCASYGVCSDDTAGWAEFRTPWGWTKAVVSNHLIECAVKLRMVQEHCAKRNDHGKLLALYERSADGLVIGEVIDGDFRLNLREACNKIVHASRVQLDFKPFDSALSVHYWNGQLQLFGEQSAKAWQLQLDVANWAKAGILFIGLAEDEGLLQNLGQDWD